MSTVTPRADEVPKIDLADLESKIIQRWGPKEIHEKYLKLFLTNDKYLTGDNGSDPNANAKKQHLIIH